MSRRLFGTDGIRGRAGEPPLDAVTIRAVSAAALGVLSARRPGAPFLVARDTRGSGPWIRDLVQAEARGLGVAVIDAGVLPTPAAAFLIPALGGCGGLVISASHNPAADNGMKFLDAEGFKLSDADEAAIEGGLGALPVERGGLRAPDGPRDFTADPALLERYLDHLLSGVDLAGLPPGFTVVADCAHGAATPVVTALSARLPIRLLPVFAAPDGANINAGCGATRPEAVAAAVREHRADLGISLDGDADRIMAADGAGRILDGDALLYLFADAMLSREGLPGPAVVGTVMTNLGLEAALVRRGVALVRTPVGDRHVQAQLRAGGLALGGEPSGHLILARRFPGGDGLLAGLFLLQVLARTGKAPAELLEGYRPYPSKIFNLRADRKPALDSLPAVVRLRERVDGRPDGRGRTVIRYSGTEPLLRILVEASDLEELMGEITPLISEIEGSLH